MTNSNTNHSGYLRPSVVLKFSTCLFNQCCTHHFSPLNRLADNTKQFTWIVKIKENLEVIFKSNPDVFVAGDLFWYPAKGSNRIKLAPDTMVVFGRPKGQRGSYRPILIEGMHAHTSHVIVN
ncbi:hypothetical protein [Cylindrospermopsis raciborskii]|uniref:hypothetical protein n=1 Tax=Cylindrospermopsis raciborskii TaxID=77022 RepID=UPI002682BB8D